MFRKRYKVRTYRQSSAMPDASWRQPGVLDRQTGEWEECGSRREARDRADALNYQHRHRHDLKPSFM